MICDKCLKEFPENEIDESHDVPKYIGGEDKDGKHYLCKECHKDYELEVLNKSSIILLKNSNKKIKSQCRFLARKVKIYFFKRTKND